MEEFLEMSNITTIAPTHAPPGTPVYLGFIAASISVLFFGSNFVPVKKFETGDGLFFQWILCAAIWFCGAVINIIMGCKQFYALAMMGGCLWSIGNTMVVPIIKTIGLGQGILIWASFNLMMGWASGRFGWFGLNPEVPPNVTLNYVGIGLCLLSSVMYVFIKSNTQLYVDGPQDTTTGSNEPNDEESDQLIPNTHVQRQNAGSTSSTVNIMPPADASFLEKLSPTARRILGCSMAVVSGLLYGASFAPVIYIIDHNKPNQQYAGASSNGLDYVFAHFTGIFGTSSVIFIIYCIIKKNTPRVYPRAILPGFVSGVMWAMADAAWFVANDALSEAISFPIITTGPAMVSALWGVVVFKEVRGRVNLLILLVAFAFGIAGSVITGVSKIGPAQTGNSTMSSI